VYVDSNVMAAALAEADETALRGLTYLPIHRANGFCAALRRARWIL